MKRLSQVSLLFGLSIFSLWLWSFPVRAAGPIIVTTTADAIAADGLCSLREAVIAANTDTATGGCPAGSGPDAITFSKALPQPVTITLTKNGANEDAANSGDLDLIGTVTITGTAGLVIDGNGIDRVFEVLLGARVTLSQVTLRNGYSSVANDGGGIKLAGRLTMSDSLVQANQGGGLSNDGGLLTLTNVQVSDNSGGYGIYNKNIGALIVTGGQVSHNQGGGIYNGNSSTATLNDLSLIGNTAGGGLSNVGVSLTRLTLSNSVVMSNTATASGGGVFNQGIGATANIFDSRIRGNQATTDGGGIFNNGIMTLNGSTLDRNQARAGGGINHFGGSLNMTNDTLSGNIATDNGGGLYSNSSAVLNLVTFSLNRASDGTDTGGNIFNDEGSLSISNSLVVEALAGGNCFNSNGFLNSLGYNLDSENSCGFNAPGDLTNTDPQLGPLQDNGGPTWTQALPPGSPALDQIPDGVNGCGTTFTTDQRGLSRPQGPACEMGAYEYGAAADLDLTVSVAPDPASLGNPLTYTLVISNLGSSAATSLTLTDTLPAGVGYLTATLTGGSCDHSVGLLTCTLAGLAAGQQVTATLVVTTPATAQVITNTATVGSMTPDLTPTNNTVTTITVVGDVPGGPLGHPVYLPIILRADLTSKRWLDQLNG